MHYMTALLPLAALAPLAHAVGNAVVLNNCPDPVYLWSVGGSVGPQQIIQPGESYSEAFHRDDASGGVSLKITTTENGLYDGSAQLNFAYTLDETQVWYDLSNVFGAPFEDIPVAVQSTNSGCPGICWPNGVPPAGSQVKTCEPNSDKVLNLCAAGC